MICDVHAHCTPSVVEAGLRELEQVGTARQRYGRIVPPVSDSEADTDARLALMDDAGVQVQVLSQSVLPLLGNEAVTVRLVPQANDALARIVARQPGRIIPYSKLPLPAPL